MKNLSLFFLLLIFISLVACEDEEITNPFLIDQYVKGELVVGFVPQTEINSAFELMNKFNFYIDHIYGFEYYSPWSPDSLEYLTQYLTSLSYLNHQGFGPGVFYNELENKIIIMPYFYGMNLINQLDWLNQVDNLELIDSDTSFAHMLIKVPVGEEISWIEELEKSEIVEWVELNYIAQITH